MDTIPLRFYRKALLSLSEYSYNINVIRLLVVLTDEEHIRALTMAVSMKEKEYAADFVSSLNAAIKKIDESAYHIILSSYFIGEKTVIDLLAHIKTIPLIVLGFPEETSYLTLALEAGAEDYIIEDRDFHYCEIVPHVIEKVLGMDRKKKRLEMQSNSESNYEALVQDLPDIVYKIDRQGKFRFVNNAIAILGYSPEELIGKHFRIILHPDDYEKVSLKRILKKLRMNAIPSHEHPKLFDERRRGERKTKDLEVRLIPKGRAEKNPVLIGSLIAFGEINAQGHYKQTEKEEDVFLGTVGIIRDITNRKKAEKLIRELFEAVDQSPVSILITDSSGIVQYANPHFYHTSGLMPYEVLEQDITDVQRGEIENSGSFDIKAIMLNTKEWEGEVVYKKGKEDISWETVHIKTITNQTGEATHYLIIKVDITKQKEMQSLLKMINDELDNRVLERTAELENTNKELQKEIHERKRIEGKLKRSEEKFRTFIETASDFMHMTDPQGYFTYVNEAMIKGLGFSKEALLQKHISEVFSRDTFKAFRPSLEKFIQKGDICLEAGLVTREGQELYGEMIVVAAYNDEGRFLGTRGIFRNLTDRKKAEEERRSLEERLQRSQKMETIGTLAGGIAHDFNNILTPILGFADVALMEIGPAGKGYDEISQIVGAAMRARDLIQQILTFSKKVEQKKSLVDVYTVIQEALHLVRATIPKTITIESHLEPDCGLIMAAPSQIMQVIINLCVNASQAMHDETGYIDILLKQKELSQDCTEGVFPLSKGKYIELIVRDTGCGMEETIIERIFDPFFTTKGKGEGTGLGLSVVHGIISSHAGAISVQSEVDKGTVFTILLPVYEGLVKEEDGEEIRYSERNEHVLVVDDEELVAGVIKRMLELLGYRVTALFNSREALGLILNDPSAYDCILVDFSMPSMTGVQFAGEIKKIRQDIPIILITGYGGKISNIELSRTDINILIKKPLSIKELSIDVWKALHA